MTAGEAIPAPVASLEVFPVRRHPAVVPGSVAVFALPGVWLALGASAGELRLAGGALIVCALLVLAYVALEICLIGKGPIYRLEADGVEPCLWKIGRIPWHAVAAVDVVSRGEGSYLVLTLHDQTAWFCRVHWWRRLILRFSQCITRLAPLYLPLSQVQADPMTIILFVYRACGHEVLVSDDASGRKIEVMPKGGA